MQINYFYREQKLMNCTDYVPKIGELVRIKDVEYEVIQVIINLINSYHGNETCFSVFLNKTEKDLA